MSLHTWWTLVVAAFFVSGTPGPNMLLMLESGMRHGMRQTFFTMAGCLLAVFSVISASLAGVGALLAKSPGAFDLLRMFGAGYLVYLGIRTACQPARAPIDSQITAEIPKGATPLQHFKSGLLVGISNPKLLLFATAFFPQFIDKTGPQLAQISIMLVSFCAIDLGWYIVYAAGGNRLARYLKHERTQKVMNRIVGVLFAGFGLMLLKYRPV